MIYACGEKFENALSIDSSLIGEISDFNWFRGSLTYTTPNYLCFPSKERV